jgi:MFS family permease
VVAVVLTRSLPETERFLALQHQQKEESPTHHSAAVSAHIHRDRLWLQIAVAVLTNIFIATASVFQIRYLKDVRDYSATLVAIFTTITAIPASIGLIVGGRIADRQGRKKLAIITSPLGAILIATSYGFGSYMMWLTAILGGICLGLAYPAMAVFRSELFPTAKRNVASAIITTASLIGGSFGLIGAGLLFDRDVSYATVMMSLAMGPVLVAVLVFLQYPETAHRKLEELNPEDSLLQIL